MSQSSLELGRAHAATHPVRAAAGMEWWSALRHDGCLIAPSRLDESFPSRPEAPLPPWIADRLRRALTRLQEEGGKEALSRAVEVVLVDVLGLPAGQWTSGSNVDTAWSHRTVTGETVKPRRVWQEPGGGVLPVFVADEGVARSRRPFRLGVGRGRRAVARTVEWLRAKSQKAGLLTNGFQWRLIHAGADFDAWCEWDIDTWFVEGHPGPQVDALRLLLGPAALHVPPDAAHSRLVEAVLATRRGQAELSAALGERVRQAVELLLCRAGSAIDAASSSGGDNPVTHRDVYIAAVRLVMRLVVLLFAESRDLLPRSDPAYYHSYSLQGLAELLDREGGGRARAQLRDQYAAWPRLLALFRLLFHGSEHERLILSRYGGGLFTPGDPASGDAVLRALAVFESPRTGISDAVVADMLSLLTRAPIKVRQGTAATWVMAPVDFSQFDTEYIGILYEGLLDFELRRAEAGIPMLFLNVGDQPALPLNRLEEMDDKAIAALVKKLAVNKAGKAAGDAAGDESDDGDATDDEDGDDPDSEDDAAQEPAPEPPADSADDDDDGDHHVWRKRANAWARRAVVAGNLAPGPKGRRSPDEERAHEAAVDAAAKRLVLRVAVPGEFYLVRFGGTRKGSGTFYTKPGLALPTIRRTLDPLCRTSGDDPAPRAPAEILDLKVCDPACGSGSFLVGVLRHLTGALYESLLAHQWLVEQPDGTIRWGEPDPPMPPWFVEFMKDVPGINEPPVRAAAARAPAPLSDGAVQINPEDRIRARLRRVIVERCVYGVDLDPLAVELARLALWVETMDPFLPFSFLDHKIKCGNSLVGCWFDRFQDYPAMAWEREGGDKGHTTGVHFPKEVWTKAIKKVKTDIVKPELAGLIESMPKVVRGFHSPDRVLTAGGLGFDIGITAEQAHEHLVASYSHLHERMSASQPEEQARIYRKEFVDNPEVRRLRFVFDLWCSIWFWPADKLDIAPTPSKFFSPPADTRAEVDRLARQMRFFHWEIEFPDVFAGATPGFSAMVGNPPWETQKPNSKEWFSNIDPLYRTCGKQDALDKQKERFAADPGTEHRWLAYNAVLKALSNWTKNVAKPFGAPDENADSFSLSRSKGENAALHDAWSGLRRMRASYCDSRHPFLHQGSADVNTYKMFLELAHALARNGGWIGLIVPSGIYTDRGTAELRALFLEGCRWVWLFGFENRNGIFDIHRSFKFCPLIVEKGGTTTEIRAAFMRRNLEDWDDAETHALAYPRSRVEQFSPKSKAILEIRSPRDLAILEKMYANGVLLGDDGPDGWGIKYAREFDMTNDSKLFPPRPQWEAKGYVPDEYGHWLKGRWRPAADVFPATPAQELWREAEWVRSRDGTRVIAIGEIEDVALPLYQGVMVGQLDATAANYRSGAGNRAVWEPQGWDRNRSPDSQFLMTNEVYRNRAAFPPGGKLAFRDITNATNERTMIAALVPDMPCGNVLGVLRLGGGCAPSDLVGNVTTFAYEFPTRLRMGGTHLNLFVAEETVVLRPRTFPAPARTLTCCLSLTSQLFAPDWLFLVDNASTADRETLLAYSWRRLWALTERARLQQRCTVDAVVAHLYGLSGDDFRHILRDCDHSVEDSSSKAFTRKLDPKGYWRVDKTTDPELRHTVLAQVAFADLQALIHTHGEDEALRRFLGTGPDDGWMLPETLRLADYNLGHDARACEPQPVAPRLGPRFHDWQQTQPAEESWAECRTHAEKIRRIRGNENGRLYRTHISGKHAPHPEDREETQPDLFGEKA